MNETNKEINEEINKKFIEMIDFINKESDVYQAMYEDVKDIHDFKSLPFTNKKLLLKIFSGNTVDFGTQRNIKTLWREGEFLRVTSGTSDMMGIFKHSNEEIERSSNLFRKHFSWYLNHFDIGEIPRACIIHNYSLSYIFIGHMMNCGCEVSVGNPYELDYTLEHIKNTDTNIIRTSPTIALKLAPLLKEQNHEIKIWILAGSGLSDLVKDKIKENSIGDPKVLIQYGMAETLNSTYQCKHLEGNSFHLFEEYFIYEFLDEDDKEVEDEKPGELVITRLSKSNPVIRYRTGDLFIKHKQKCSCGKSIYSCIGRAEEFIKINGVVLFKDKIENAIESIKDRITGEYQLEFKEIEEEGFVKSKLILKIDPILKTPKECEIIARIFADNFEVSENYYWTQGMLDNVFMPVKVSIKQFKDINKTKQIIDSRWIRGK